MNKLLEIGESLLERFKEDSKFRVKAIAGTALAVIIGAGYFGEDDGPYVPKKRLDNKTKSMFVSDESAAELSQDNINSTYEALQRQSAEVEETTTGLYVKWQKEKEELLSDSVKNKQEMQKLKRQMALLMSQGTNANAPTIRQNVEGSNEHAITEHPNEQVNNNVNQGQQISQQVVRRTNANIITSSPVIGNGLRIISQSKETLVNSNGSTTKLRGKALDTQNQLTKAKKVPAKEKEKPFWLPAGSMITGVMITGVNAPTHPSASSEPEPVNIRITEDVILPGGYTADLKGCTIIGGAIGSLKDDRAKIRSELISCVREDGKAIEVNLLSYASGSDGLQGVKGLRVSLAAPVVTSSIMAGMAGGFAGAMTPTQIPSLQTGDSGGDTLYKSPDLGQVAGIAGLNGISRSFSRAEEYFMDLADQMHPYIEIQAGRRVEMTTQKGVSLQIKS